MGITSHETRIMAINFLVCVAEHPGNERGSTHTGFGRIHTSLVTSTGISATGSLEYLQVHARVAHSRRHACGAISGDG